ncbi:U2 snRNP complex subunit MSL1 [Kluyveromyces lactis]|uniref:KLLA0B11594p n=1 Tax=Kluyveromyces lactis (strain ATCC 8585 / CBS 2359 / DSM 70799 / NBRC 1267 / NRRL Y-1140 / WM37) TaxID=284590 RepID=Q6CVJ3_KLULA|nr:uncharacterized protein KLLA0_B11594g [Kluyveromyces lactis]CAH02439.1 KLLA0B11594p [Kluyveromyces lactis]|eukprot:XP_452046.1 uncharacterized protein KLLA0_B11594g [Kluyveromyces lactis]
MKQKNGYSTEPPTKKQKTQQKTTETIEIEPNNTVYVKNLNDQIKIQTVRESLYMLFATYGEVIKVSMTPKQRGQAFITFKSVDEANLALLSLKDELFFNKPLVLQFSKQTTTKL